MFIGYGGDNLRKKSKKLTLKQIYKASDKREKHYKQQTIRKLWSLLKKMVITKVKMGFKKHW